MLAVDGGGVKTDLALLDSSGALLSFVRGGGSQAHYLGVEGCVEVLEGLLERAPSPQAGLGRLERPFAATAQVLLAGVDLPEELAALRAGIERLHWSERLVIGNDTLALLRAGTDRGWGIAVVCGTDQLPRARSGGGRRRPGSCRSGRCPATGAAAATSAWPRWPRPCAPPTGAGRATVLERAVPATSGWATRFDVARAVHLEELPAAAARRACAGRARRLRRGSVAAGIVERLADEVVAFARAALRRLELTGADPDVVLGGRLLRALPPGVIETIARGVQQVAPDARVVVSRSEPIVGAALLGLDAIGADPSAKARARAELDAAVAELSAAVVDRLG